MNLKRSVIKILTIACFSVSLIGQASDTGSFRKDSSLDSMDGVRKKGSHVKVFLPTLPYIAMTHSLNAGFVRPADNEQGWVYDMAVGHERTSKTTYQFKLRKGVRFQDGTTFNAQSVVDNLMHFKKEPYVYTRVHEVFDRAEVVDEYTVNVFLKEEYGIFIHESMWLHFYSSKYLEKFGWNGRAVAPNQAEAGPYGLGPFILKEGYIEGDRRTSKAVLEANPYYWDQKYPKVDKVTIYTDLKTDKAIDLIQNTEGELDYMPIPFAAEMETILSPFAKLVRASSTSNYAVPFNMINGHPLIREKEIRQVINRAIDQKSLLNQAMNGEGELSATVISNNFYGVKQARKGVKPYSEVESPLQPNVQAKLHTIVKQYQLKYEMGSKEPLRLKFLTPESHIFLVRDLKHLLSKIGIELEVIVKPESEVFSQLLQVKAGTNSIKYDFLIWRNDDWIRHPFSAYSPLLPSSIWSTLGKDDVLEGLMNTLFRATSNDQNYVSILQKITSYLYDKSYMMFLPSPHNVAAMNKEVYFKLRPSSFIPLWEIEVSDFHWSIRGEKAYPSDLKKPVVITSFFRK